MIKRYLQIVVLSVPVILISGCRHTDTSAVPSSADNVKTPAMSKEKEILEKQYKDKLTPLQYSILREKATEKPFSGKYDLFFKDGTYYCAACGQKLFTSDSKYNSGCGWPAFSTPSDKTALTELPDNSLNIARTEVICSNCKSHLGHLFNDGPAPAHLRYCINSTALNFKPADPNNPDNK